MARLLILVAMVYNVGGLTLAFNSFGVTPYMTPQPPPWSPLTATLLSVMAIGVWACALLLPCVTYYRITRAHKQSAGILLIVGGAVLTATAPFFSILTVISGVLFLAAGTLALVSQPGEETPIHTAESILPLNR
jgi:hypothetical protein